MDRIKKFFKKAGTHSFVIAIIILVHIAIFTLVGLIVASTQNAYGGEGGVALDFANGNDSAGFWVSLAMFIVAYVGIMTTITIKLVETKQIKFGRGKRKGPSVKKAKR